jgi:hypothetical protein
MSSLAVLDEAHKYLQNSDSARLTQSISNTIRLQRHLATRVIIATQEPTVIPPAMLDLASIIVCHRFSSPAWCAHLARHVSAGSDSAAASASWYQQVMLLPTGHALVFSPAAVITADERGGVGLLGRDHLKLRVRPRLTRDGGASLLAVGRSLPVIAGAPPQGVSPQTPATSRSSTAAPTPTVAHAMPFAASTWAVPAPSAAAIAESSVPGAHTVPGHLQLLVVWLSRSGAADAPVSLSKAKSALLWVWAKDYVPGMPKKGGWWTRLLREAVGQGLVELINADLTNKQRKVRGVEKMIRLLAHSSLAYV